MLNYVGPIASELHRISNTDNVHRWLIAPCVHMAYSIPAFTDRAEKSKVLARSKRSTRGNYRPDGASIPGGTLEDIVLRIRKVNPDVSQDKHVSRAMRNVQRAQNLEREQILNRQEG